MKDFFWNCFTETGNIELYLAYKEYSRKREKEREDNARRTDKDKGSCCEGGKQRGQ